MKVLRREGRTPSGGAYSEAVFMDGEGNVADREKATQVRVTEFDEKGRRIKETWAYIER